MFQFAATLTDDGTKFLHQYILYIVFGLLSAGINLVVLLPLIMHKQLRVIKHFVFIGMFRNV
jgi:hypothetical protein